MCTVKFHLNFEQEHNRRDSFANQYHRFAKPFRRGSVRVAKQSAPCPPAGAVADRGRSSRWQAPKPRIYIPATGAKTV